MFDIYTQWDPAALIPTSPPTRLSLSLISIGTSQVTSTTTKAGRAGHIHWLTVDLQDDRTDIQQGTAQELSQCFGSHILYTRLRWPAALLRFAAQTLPVVAPVTKISLVCVSCLRNE